MHGLDFPFASRLTPARPDLAAEHLRDRVAAERYVRGVPHRVSACLLDLRLAPDRTAERATQLLYGEVFIVYETRPDGLAWGQAELDGYVGFVDAAGLGPQRGTGRRITALWSHLYARASVQGDVTVELPFLADVPVAGSSGCFARLRGGGHVPLRHLDATHGDAAAQAERFLGAPYLWGGRSIRGIDCSALVQLAHLACGKTAPRDSDMQAALLGAPLSASAPLQRGDLVFWRGHVGMMLDATRVIHANAHHMAVACEPLAAVEARVLAAGGGPITGRRRP